MKNMTGAFSLLMIVVWVLSACGPAAPAPASVPVVPTMTLSSADEALLDLTGFDPRNARAEIEKWASANGIGMNESLVVGVGSLSVPAELTPYSPKVVGKLGLPGVWYLLVRTEITQQEQEQLISVFHTLSSWTIITLDRIVDRHEAIAATEAILVEAGYTNIVVDAPLAISKGGFHLSIKSNGQTLFDVRMEPNPGGSGCDFSGSVKGVIFGRSFTADECVSAAAIATFGTWLANQTSTIASKGNMSVDVVKSLTAAVTEVLKPWLGY